MLTVAGEIFAGRVATSLLTAVGLPELVAGSVRDYVAKATDFAGNRAELARLREFLQEPGRASRLFDTQATTRAIETAYLAMAEQYRQGRRELIKVPG